MRRRHNAVAEDDQRVPKPGDKYKRLPSKIVQFAMATPAIFEADPDWDFIEIVGALTDDIEVLGKTFCIGAHMGARFDIPYIVKRSNWKSRWKRALRARYGKENVVAKMNEASKYF